MIERETDASVLILVHVHVAAQSYYVIIAHDQCSHWCSNILVLGSMCAAFTTFCFLFDSEPLKILTLSFFAWRKVHWI